MLNLGMVRPGQTIYIPFDSFDGGTGASITLTGLATTDIEVYKDASMTQRGSDSGFSLMDTDGIDLDTITGIHGIQIDLADNTTAGFWAAGSKYWVVISSVTIDAQTVNFIAAYFTIGYPDALHNTTIATLSSQTSFTLTDGPAEDDALNGCVVVIHDVASKVQHGFAIVSDYTGASKTVTLVAGTTFTAAATDNISFYPPSNITHAAQVAWGSGAITAGVLASDTITAAKIAAGAITNAKFAAGAIDAAALAADASTEINAAVLAVLGALNDAAADGAVTTTDTMVAYLKQIINTLEGAPGMPTWPAAVAPGNGVSIAEALRYLYDQVGVAGAGLTAVDDAVLAAIPSAATIADAVWDEAQAGHVGAGTFGEIASEIADILTDTGTTLQGELDGIQADTEDIQTRLPAALTADGNIKADTLRIGGTLQTANDVGADVNDILADTGTDGVVVAAASKTGYALSAAGIQAIWDALTAALTTVGSIGKLIVDNLNATVGSRASQTTLDTLDDYVDSEVAAIKAVTDKLDTSLELDGAVYRFTTNALEQGPGGGAGIADAVWDEDQGEGETARQLMRGIRAALFGKLQDAATVNPKFYAADGSTVRINATVDGTGDRDSVTVNL